MQYLWKKFIDQMKQSKYMDDVIQKSQENFEKNRILIEESYIINEIGGT